MKRAIVLSLLLATGGLTIAAAAAMQGQGGNVVEVEKVRDNLFMLKGGGGNTAVFVQSNGVTVVDTKNPGWGQPILDKIKELTPKPVSTIINTHTHGDHVSGNVDFAPTVDVVVQENTAANMRKMIAPPGLPANPTPSVFDKSQGRGMPKKTFTDKMTLFSGADRVELMYFGRGHTNGDAWVLFPALRVLHAGDIFSGKNLPLLDTNNGGSGVLIADTLSKAHAATAKTVDTIITGHSTLMTPADLAEYVEFNRDFLNTVREGKKAGRTTDDIIAAYKMPAKYKGYADPQAARLKSNVEGVYKELP